MCTDATGNVAGTEAGAPKPAHLAGLDEAGLGPLLGPLCIGMTRFQLPLDSDGGLPNLWKILSKAVTADPKTRDRRTVICDSKKLHKPASIRPLEETALTLLAACAPEGEPPIPATAADYLARVSLTPLPAFIDYPWYADGRLESLTLPREALRERVESRGETLRTAGGEVGVTLQDVRVRPVLAGELNERLANGTSKSRVELAVLAAVLGWAWGRQPDLRAAIDRLGGTDFYGPGLRQAFPDASLTIVGEKIELKRVKVDTPSNAKHKAKRNPRRDDGPPRMSRYRLTLGAAEMDLVFITGAEARSLPVATASILAKYTRELLLEAFNGYWAERYPDLAPTKGYYVDGQRFLDDLRTRGADLSPIADRLIRKR